MVQNRTQRETPWSYVTRAEATQILCCQLLDCGRTAVYQSLHKLHRQGVSLAFALSIPGQIQAQILMRLACPPSYPWEAVKTQTPLSKPGFQVEELKFVPVRTWQWVFENYSKQMAYENASSCSLAEKEGIDLPGGLFCLVMQFGVCITLPGAPSFRVFCTAF